MRTHSHKGDLNPGRSDSTRRGAVSLKVLAPIIVLALLGGGYLAMRGGGLTGGGSSDADGAGAIKWPVQRQDLVISAVASGELRTKNMIEVHNPVKTHRQLKIVYIIPEGSSVKKGDVLVELDASELVETFRKQKIMSATADEAVVSAEADVQITKRKFETDMLVAENNVDIAEILLRKYIEGDYPQTIRKAEGELFISEERLERDRDTLEWTKKLAAKNFVADTELDADQLKVNSSEVAAKTAKEDLRVLKEYSYEQELKTLENTLVEAEGFFDEVKLTGDREISSTQTKLIMLTEKADLERVQTESYEEQVSGATILAPESGLVVYHKERSRYGSQDSVLQVGSTVYPRQRLIDLPDFSTWIFEARVHESWIQRVQMGQRAFMTLDSSPDHLLEGAITKIGVLPDSQNWMRDTQEYLVEIDLEVTDPTFKPGMSGRSEIIMKELKGVIAIPIQAVSVRDGQTVVFVSGEVGPIMQEVEVGANNDRLVEIVSGLAEGQEVFMDQSAGSDTGLGPRPSELASNDQRSKAGDAADEAKEATANSNTAGDSAEHGRGEGRRGGMGGGRPGNMDPEQMKKMMEERMKDMTPEQKAQMEERMKQFQNGGGMGGGRPGGQGGGQRGGRPEGGQRGGGGGAGQIPSGDGAGAAG